ncbi:hypothetical protein [Vulcanisaeta sp. JCM 16159]|uniref:hypothetical protein n=1 Tax=Vulcanisaeta sp. JCM 16159 TaxID=1295371 RepID=UPI0006CFCE84|nr:hypothetical protein [Vulcanisaeta sp. JCM 16159]
MSLARHLLAGFVGALFFLALYLLFVWLQFRLLASPEFMRALGLYSLLVFHINRLGIDLVPIIIDAVVLAVLVLTNLGSLNALAKALKMTAIVSVTIASTASLAYSLIIHGSIEVERRECLNFSAGGV